jgi:hypothetical protein
MCDHLVAYDFYHAEDIKESRLRMMALDARLKSDRSKCLEPGEIAERYGILELMAKILQKLVQRGFSITSWH